MFINLRALYLFAQNAQLCYRAFLYAENIITAIIYLDMLHLFVFPQIGVTEQAEEVGEILFQQNSSLHHFTDVVQNALNIRFPT
jgi:hypothetical protein